MKFTSGARVRHATFTLVPSRKTVLPNGDVEFSKPLRAVFREHKFDSEVAQRLNDWTDEERELVEHKLQKHRRFNQSGGRGIFINKLAHRAAPASAVEADTEAEQRGRKLRCLHFSEDDDGSTTQCEDMADPEFPQYDLCAKHREELLEQRGSEPQPQPV